MKAAVVNGDRNLEVREVAQPEIGAYECLVEIDACAICTGTDSNIIAGNFPGLPDPPFILGHESTGIIKMTGDRVRNFEIGERVTRAAGVLPGRRRDGLASVWGGFAEMGMVVDTEAAASDGRKYSLMAEKSRNPLPSWVGPVWGALSINQREILSLVNRMDIDGDSRCVVIGSGYNGLLFSLLLKNGGAGGVLVVGNGNRRELALGTYKADNFLDYRDENPPSDVHGSLGGPPNLVIDAVGTRESVGFARRIVNQDTIFGKYGMHEYDLTEDLVCDIAETCDIMDMTTDEVSATQAWQELYKEGIFTGEMYDVTLPLNRIGEAFRMLDGREAVKLVIVM